ncbi:MAG: putative DNA modification/repair radical SAM protein [Ruminococcaceae bacterium]|nr:putative DNA modification/repair radical SAM protein [Oscillospiraceae bacterium]
MADFSFDRIFEKLNILGEAAKFDVSCVSSGVNRKGSGKAGTIGSSVCSGICHSFTADGRCVSLLKVLLSNDCVYDCKYCINRRTEDKPRVSFTPEELAELTIEFYRRNYIEGLFLSSAVVISPDHTMEQMCRVLMILRRERGFFGYIHVKAIPGASPELIELAGRLADRMSLNVEFPGEEGLKKFAPQKKKENIFGTMKYIEGRIAEDKDTWIFKKRIGASRNEILLKEDNLPELYGTQQYMPKSYGTKDFKSRNFVPGGQSTQMIIGATDDSDKKIIKLTESMYKKLSLKRVFYSAFVPVNKDPLLPTVPPPLLREHRLYQADWLLRFYGFSADEILDDEDPYLDLEFDPKCTWALRHMELFPIEINNADRDTLLRIPGIGVRSVSKIIKARQSRSLDFDDLRKLGIVLKRARFFIICKGKTMGPMDGDPAFIKANLSYDIRSVGVTSGYVQLSFFDSNDKELLPRQTTGGERGVM